MKNFNSLNLKCEGRSPQATAEYITKRCEHPVRHEKVFADMLVAALKKIAATANEKNRCYLYNQKRKDWSAETQKAFEKADKIYEEPYGESALRVYKFRGEERVNYYLVEGNQLSEAFEILFIEEL